MSELFDEMNYSELQEIVTTAQKSIFTKDYVLTTHEKNRELEFHKDVMS